MITDELALTIINSIAILGIALLIWWYISYGAKIQMRAIIRTSKLRSTS